MYGDGGCLGGVYLCAHCMLWPVSGEKFPLCPDLLSFFFRHPRGAFLAGLVLASNLVQPTTCALSRAHSLGLTRPLVVGLLEKFLAGLEFRKKTRPVRKLLQYHSRKDTLAPLPRLPFLPRELLG